MPYTPETIAIKPYNQCIRCAHIGIKCDGPNVIAMSKERFCEWSKYRKEELGWSNAKLAEVAEVSKPTIDRIMSGKMAGINAETMSTITCALVYGYACHDENWGKYPCPMAATKQEEECSGCSTLRLQLKQQSENHRGKIDHLKQQIAFYEQQLRAKDHQLEEESAFIAQRNRVVRILSVLLGLAVLVIIAALLIDATNPNVGFIWPSRTILS